MYVYDVCVCIYVHVHIIITVGLKKKCLYYLRATLEVLRLCIEGAREVLSKVTVVEAKVSALREQLPSGFIDPCLY